MSDNNSRWNQLFDDLHEAPDQDTSEHYSVLEKIGHGGSKTISRATDNLSGRDVAFARPIKNDTKTIELFLREARITAYLQHPNILPIYDMNDGEEPYLVCKLLRGSNLAKFCTKKHTQRDLLPLFQKICEAMDYAHSRGVLHLDIKPDNIHLDKYGEVLVIDWGLAEIFLTESQESPLDNPLISTRESLATNATFCGTPGFMSPEQIRSEKVDTRSDIFSLGALLFSMFFNDSPFSASNLKTICAKTQLAEIPHFDQRRMSSGLSSIMIKCLQANKVDRYNTVRELIDDLDALQNDFIPSAEEANFTHHCKMLYKRNRQSCHLLLVSLILICTLSVFYIKNVNKSRDQALLAKSEAVEAKEQAEAYLTQIISEQEQNQKLSIALAPRYLNIANEYWNFYELEKAIDYCELALRVHPQNREAKHMRAKLYLVYGNYKRAQALWHELKSSSDENTLNEHLLDAPSKKASLSRILNSPLNSSDLKKLKSRAFFYAYKTSLKIDLLKKVLLIENSKSKNIDFHYDGKVFELQNNHTFVNINFIRVLKPSILNLRRTRVDNISALSHLNFDELNLSHLPLWDLTPLIKSKINNLNLSYSYVENLWSLIDCELKELNINHTKIKDIPDALLDTLELLSMNKTHIRKLPEHPALKLHTLNITNNQIRNLEVLNSYSALQELIVDKGQLPDKLIETLTKKGVKITQLSSSSSR